MTFTAALAAFALLPQDPVPEWTQLPVGFQDIAAQYARPAGPREGAFSTVWRVTVLKRPIPSPQGEVHGYEHVVTFNCEIGLQRVERKVALLKDGSRAEWLPVTNLSEPVPTTDADQAVYRFACPFRQDWPRLTADTAGLLNH